MTDTRIEDRRKAGWSDREILAGLCSIQEGSQIWMNRDAKKRDVNQYLSLADEKKANYTEKELAWLSTAEAAERYKEDPVSFLALYARNPDE